MLAFFLEAKTFEQLPRPLVMAASDARHTRASKLKERIAEELGDYCPQRPARINRGKRDLDISTSLPVVPEIVEYPACNWHIIVRNADCRISPERRETRHEPGHPARHAF